MGNALSSCCSGSSTQSSPAATKPPTHKLLPGRPKDGIYEPALADIEREAVADLLQFLENASLGFQAPISRC